MSLDTPARIAILGAGPIGLETALYARFLGYEIDLFEQSTVAANVQRWGHVRMFSPFSMNSTPLGLAAIRAQDDANPLPSATDTLTGAEFIERYLRPLASSDLMVDHIHEETVVLGVGRQGLNKEHPIGTASREGAKFVVLVDNKDTGEARFVADAVIDTTGTFENSKWLGSDGIPALGERQLRNEICYHIPDILGADRNRYADRRVLLIGGGYSAATAVVCLSRLAVDASDTHITWITRSTQAPPISELNKDPLPSRRELAAKANEVAANSSCVQYLPGMTISSVKRSTDGDWSVKIEGQESMTLEVDEMIALIGYRPDNKFTSELQIHTCYATEGPIQLAANLIQADSADCLQQPSVGIDSLKTTEPRFFVLGSKSYGRNPQFLLSSGHDQIRTVFSYLGGRDDLDLYQNMNHLLA